MRTAICSVALCLLIELVSPLTRAATYTAASCNETDVNAVINGPTHTAVAGDVIQVPTGSCTWTSEMLVPVSITITGLGATPNTTAATFGAGTTGVTIIDDQTNTSIPMLYFSGATQGQLLVFQNFTIEPFSSSTQLMSPIWVGGTCNSSGCPQLRFDNLNFSGWNSSGNGVASSWSIREWNFFGVFDHNTSSAVGTAFLNVNLPAYLGIGSFGDNSWAQPDTFGSASAIYIENNLFQPGVVATDTDNADTTNDIGGARFVVRFNEYTGLNGSAAGNHGTETTGRPRGGRQMEVYGNTITCTGNCVGVVATVRSGAALFFDNAVTVSGTGAAANGIAALLVERTYRGPASPWGNCDGSGSWDDNDGTAYHSGTVTTSGTGSFSDSAASWTSNQWVSNGSPYSIHDATQGFGDEIDANTANSYSFTTSGPPVDINNNPWTWADGDSYQILRATVCIDQPTRGEGSYISGGTPSPTGWVNEVLDPIYEWNDSVSGTYYNPGFSQTVNGTIRLIANRDWYQSASGVQTSQTSPFNGTSGTGWGTLANRPTSCTIGVGYWATDQGNWNTNGSGGQGELFVCTATNTWSLHYQPYTYPHPLTASSIVNTPTNLTAAVH